MPSWITVCDTCKCESWDPDLARQTDGETLADLIESSARDVAGVATRRVSCTMGCERACNVVIQASGKIGYSLGRFGPTPEDAAAIVEYARMHAESETGRVPFREWPPGVKGHFISRHTPVPE